MKKNFENFLVRAYGSVHSFHPVTFFGGHEVDGAIKDWFNGLFFEVMVEALKELYNGLFILAANRD